jgi:hypothetical protein
MVEIFHYTLTEREKKMVTGCHKFRVEELYYCVTFPDLGCWNAIL